MTRVTQVALCGLFLLSNLCEPVQAKGFLARLDDLESIMDDAKELLGSEHYAFAKKKIAKIEYVLRPIYMTMPKNEKGKLGHAAASYALHRLFVQRHGWYVTGLQPEGKGFKAWSTTSPSTVLRKHMPESTLLLLEQRLFKNGYGLHELAIAAATVEHFVRIEEAGRLNTALKAHHIPTSKSLSVGEVDDVLDSYMTLYILGFLLPSKNTPTPDQVKYLRQNMPEIYPGWAMTQEFVREVRQSVIPKSDSLSVLDVSMVVEEAGERYGRFQDTECRDIAAHLFAIEDTSAGGAGRVRLADFYRAALQDKRLQFTESKTYLRKLGALDESDSNNPRVIITNYLYGPSNCVASSQYYEVCCMNQCDELMGHLEQEVAAPEASPQQIVTIVASLASASVPHGKVVSPWLRRQLDEIATLHAGRIPVHGRLFAQWMHSAYPRECPYPQLSGASNPATLSHVVSSTAALNEAVATQQEMQRIVAAAPPQSKSVLDPSAHEASDMVSMQEELVV